MADTVQQSETASETATKSADASAILPLSRRKVDLLFIAFFLVNLFFVTYIVDIEQIIIADPAHFQYPLWPPPFFVDMVHSYARSLDPLVLARPPWWKATIWLDALFFGPYYAVALYAFIKGKNWIRIPSVIWASVLMTNVIIILSEEFFGPSATPHPVIVFLLNLPWLLFPLGMIARMARKEQPFASG
jgi:hypothetical protein